MSLEKELFDISGNSPLCFPAETYVDEKIDTALLSVLQIYGSI